MKMHIQSVDMTKISASIRRPTGSTAICQKASISMRTTKTSYDRSKTATATTSSSHRFSASQSIHQHPNYQNAILLLLPLLIMILKETSALPPIIKIGAIFNDEQKNSPIELAFKYAVYKINKDKILLPRTTLVYDFQYVPMGDSFHASKKVCDQIKMGVTAIFGPSDPVLGSHINSICDALDIPYLDARIDMLRPNHEHQLPLKSPQANTPKQNLIDPLNLVENAFNSITDMDASASIVDSTPATHSLNKRFGEQFAIHLNPSQSLINNAFKDVMRFLNWTKVAIIYERSHDLIKLRDVMRAKGYEMYVRQAEPNNYLHVLEDLKMKEISNIIIDIHPKRMTKLLNVILQLQMNEYKYHYLYTKLDIDAFDLDDFKYNFVNITAFRLVDIENIGVREVIKDMKRFQQKQQQKYQTKTQSSSSDNANEHRHYASANQSQPSKQFNHFKFIETEAALIYDSVHVFAIGLQTLEQSHTLRISNVSCAEERPWDGGLSLINYINTVEWKGLSGPIEFKEGRRIQFKLDLVKLKPQSLVKVGEWSPQIGLNITDQSIFFDTGRINVTLLVVTILEIPYVMMHYGKNLTGNERFFGFCVDILARVANEVGFDYILDLVPDKKYGAFDPMTGEWNGMVLQLMKHETPYVMLRKPFSNTQPPLTRTRILPTKKNPSNDNIAVQKDYSQSIVNITQNENDERYLHHHSRSDDNYWIPYLMDQSINDDDMDYLADDENVELRRNIRTTIDSGVETTTASTASNNENDMFEGFCIDVLRLIAKMVGFEYNIKLVADGKYGLLNPDTGEWNGIVRELIDKRADLAVASMTINYARESVIDFTKPFMNLGIGILFKVPTTQPTRLFSFMNPLAVDIWLYVLGAYCLVSFAIYICARFSPYEWHNPHPCDVDNEIIVNQFTIASSFWFSIGTLMQQGSDLNPKATSTRIVGGIWWFFTLILISSYTANLAAFLTVERMITPINSAEDLAAQADIAYGTLESGSTMTFFRDSMIETYKKMWRFMESKKPTVFTSTYEEGMRRVLDGNYAFLMESTMLDYAVQRDCNLTQIGGLLDTKGYGIATPMGSPWRDKISLAILELQEKGEIQMLYDKWWKLPKDSCPSDRVKQSNKANALGVNNIGGVFVVLLCGLAFAVLIAILEFFHSTRRPQRRLDYISTGNASNNYLETDSTLSPFNDDDADICLQRQSLFSHMADELCLAIRCQGSQQRTAFKRNCSKCRQIRKQYHQQQQQQQQQEKQQQQQLKETTTGVATSISTALSNAGLSYPTTSINAHTGSHITQTATSLFEMKEFGHPVQ